MDYSDLIKVCKSKDPRLNELKPVFRHLPKSSVVLRMAQDPEFAQALSLLKFSEVELRNDILTAIFEIHPQVLSK